MAGNASQGGSAFRGRHDDWWYLERLPPTARKALADAMFNWSAGWIYGLWNRGVLKTGADVAARIRQIDELQAAREWHRVWKIEDRVSRTPRESRCKEPRRRESPR
jgi:Family of unknown function (DUF6525)